MQQGEQSLAAYLCGHSHSMGARTSASRAPGRPDLIGLTMQGRLRYVAIKASRTTDSESVRTRFLMYL